MKNIMRKADLTGIIIIIAAIIICVNTNIARSGSEEDPLVGKPCPEITTLFDVNSGAAKGNYLAGPDNVTVIIFFKTYNATSRKMLEAARAIQKDEKNARVVAICLDTPVKGRQALMSDQLTIIKKYARHYNYPYTFLLSTDKDTLKQFGFMNVPGIVIADKQNRITFRQQRYLSGFEKRILSEIQKALAKTEAP